MSTRISHVRVCAVLGSIALAATLGGTAAAAPAAAAAAAAAKVTPTTRLTLEDHKIDGMPKSFAPGWHTFILSQKANDGRSLSLLQPHAGTSWATVKSDIANGLEKLENGTITTKTIASYKKLTKEATFLGGINVPSEFGTQNTTFTVKLVPGVVVFKDDNVDEDGAVDYATVPVTSGRTVGSQPKATASIVAHEFGFIPVGVKAGSQKYTIHNGGKEPHMIGIEYISPDHTDAEVLAALQGLLQGDALPAWINDAAGDDILSPGQSTTVTLNLKAGGHYLIVSFVPDVSTGLPDLFLGMDKQLHV